MNSRAPQCHTDAAGRWMPQGDWTLQSLVAAGGGGWPAPAVGPDAHWDLSALHGLDLLGAQQLWRLWGGQWPPGAALAGVQAPHRRLLELAAQTPALALPAPAAAPDPSPVHRLGAQALRLARPFWGQLLDALGLLGQLLLDTWWVLRQPRQGPWRELSGHLAAMGAQALAITALVGFLIGVVLAYLSAQQLRQFGADAFIVNLMGLALVRELGPMLAAILIAGRSGSAITAQLGAMRVTEELDAMRVMGIAPSRRLVWPMAVALALALPLVAVWTTLAALLGGMLAAWVVLGLSPAFFVAGLPGAVPVVNLGLAMGKSVVFGLLIAGTGCHFGLRVRPDTVSLGRGTTQAVVVAITAVILADAVAAVLFQRVGL